MKNLELVEFKKERDLGAIITDTFKFIRENWKEYFSLILKIAGPAFVIFIVAMGYYMITTGDVMAILTESIENSGGYEPDTNLMVMFGSILIAAIAGVVFYVLMQMASLFFIKSYINNNGVVDKIEVSQNVKKHFWSFLGLAILTLIMVVFGVFLCFFPAIWIGVVLSLGSSILLFEGKSVGDTISHCFTLIKDHWWETFGVVLVVGILVSLLGQVFAVPSLIYTLIKMSTVIANEDPTVMSSLFSDPIYLALTILSYVGQFLLSTISIITSVFIYFDLNEQKNLTGTIESIESIGNN